MNQVHKIVFKAPVRVCECVKSSVVMQTATWITALIHTVHTPIPEVLQFKIADLCQLINIIDTYAR